MFDYFYSRTRRDVRPQQRQQQRPLFGLRGQLWHFCLEFDTRMNWEGAGSWQAKHQQTNSESSRAGDGRRSANQRGRPQPLSLDLTMGRRGEGTTYWFGLCHSHGQVATDWHGKVVEHNQCKTDVLNNYGDDTIVRPRSIRSIS